MTGNEKILRRKKYLENKIDEYEEKMLSQTGEELAKSFIKRVDYMIKLDDLYKQWCLPSEQRIEKYK